jgi:GNAT superfamily N-acetyltransferase
MVRISNAQAEADRDPERDTVDARDTEYANLTNCDPMTDVRIAEVGDRMVGYARVDWEDQNDGSRRYGSLCRVDPDVRRRGIGGTLLAWSLERIRAIGGGHDFAGERWIGAWLEDTDEAGRDLLTGAGFRPVRSYLLMVRPTLDDIELTPLPPGIEVRPVRDEDLRAIFLADDEAFHDHFGGGDASDAAFRRWTGHPAFDPSLFVVAWDGGEVAAAVLGLIDAAENDAHGYRRGWLDSVFTRRPWRRQGLARALVGRSLVLLRDRGMTSAQLGVDAENPREASSLYASSGFDPTHGSTVFRRDWD